MFLSIAQESTLADLAGCRHVGVFAKPTSDWFSIQLKLALRRSRVAEHAKRTLHYLLIAEHVDQTSPLPDVRLKSVRNVCMRNLESRHDAQQQDHCEPPAHAILPSGNRKRR